MKLDPARKPYGFICVECGGCCDIVPPDDRWESHKCGALYQGLRCGKPVRRRSLVCADCEWSVGKSLISSHEGQQMLIRLLGGVRRADERISAQRVMDQAARRFEKETAEEEKREAKRRQRESGAGYVVYYARLGLNHIKIGTSNALPRRMKELRVVNPENLLAAEPGGYKVEKARHEQFKKWRWNPRTEDFGEGPDLLEHIKATRAEHGDPYALAARLHQEPKAA